MADRLARSQQDFRHPGRVCYCLGMIIILFVAHWVFRNGFNFFKPPIAPETVAEFARAEILAEMPKIVKMMQAKISAAIPEITKIVWAEILKAKAPPDSPTCLPPDPPSSQLSDFAMDSAGGRVASFYNTFVKNRMQ